MNLDVKCKEGKKGFGFMKCLTQQDLENAVSFDGNLVFKGKKLELRMASERKKERGDRGDRDHKKRDYKKDY